QEALGLAELLTDPIKKVQALRNVAEQMRTYTNRDSTWLEVLFQACEVAYTIEMNDERTQALIGLATTLAQAHQWEQAERVIGMIRGADTQVTALSELATALAQAQQWE